MDLDYATGIIKDYVKLNRKTNKKTIQKQIKSFNNLQIFTDAEPVAIISVKDLELLTADNDTLAINNDLVIANDEIKELTNEIELLTANNVFGRR